MEKSILISEFNQLVIKAYARGIGFETRMMYQSVCRETGMYKILKLVDRTKMIKPRQSYTLKNIKAIVAFYEHSLKLCTYDKEAKRAYKESVKNSSQG